MAAAKRQRIDSGRTTRRRSTYRGIPVVPGIAIGSVHLKFMQTQVLSDRQLKAEDVEFELERFTEAIRVSKEQLMVARKKVATDIGELEATIFDAHIALFEDPTLIKQMRGEIEQNMRPAEVVVSEVVEGYYNALAVVEDEHIRERAADIRDVGRRLLNNLTALEPKEDEPAEKAKAGILFARELLPSDVAALDSSQTLGVITEMGNDRGHCAIMLRAMGIPCVMGIDGMLEKLRDNDTAIVDGTNGTVLINPRPEVVAEYQGKQSEYESYRDILLSEQDADAVTLDGMHVSLQINVGHVDEMAMSRRYGADGVGLYRTEFELMTRSTYPDEQVQFEMYRDMVEAVEGKPITFRTMDIGSEKELAYFEMPEEENHALGLRSIRLARALEEHQLIQLRAILRASAYGNVRIMFPFITNVEDMRYGRKLVRQAMRTLKERGQEYDAGVLLGMMVEVPTAALSLKKYLRESQFFSVGTNDLTQYLCAADRNQKEVASWYSGHNPGVLALLSTIVDTLNGSGRPLTICGEMAGDPLYTMFLLGIGVRNLSMSAPQIPIVKKIIRSIDTKGAEKLAEKALSLSTTTQVRDLFLKTVEQTLGRDLAVWLR